MRAAIFISLFFLLACEKTELELIQVRYQGYGECTYRAYYWDGEEMIQSNTAEFEFCNVVYLSQYDTARLKVIADHSDVDVWLMVDWQKLMYQTVHKGDTIEIIYVLRN